MHAPLIGLFSVSLRTRKDFINEEYLGHFILGKWVLIHPKKAEARVEWCWVSIQKCGNSNQN